MERRLRRTLLGAAGVAAAAHVGPGAAWLPPVRRKLPATLDGRGRPQTVAITFDDGPDPASTPQILEVLADLGVTSTFFLLGEMAQQAPELVSDLVAAGHEVALHGWHHRNSLRVTPWALGESLVRAKDLLEELSGRPVRYYRPPYGVLTAGNLLAARRLHLQTVLWGAWGKDWAPTATPATVMRTVLQDLRPGGTVLLHDSDCTSSPGSWRSTLGAVRPLVEQVRSQGLQTARLGEHLAA